MYLSPTRKPQSRRFGAMALWLVIVMGSVSAAMAAAQPIELAFWHGLTGPDREGIILLVDQFNEEYDGRIAVENSPIPWPELHTRYQVAAAAGASPDVGVMHRAHMTGYILQGIVRPITDLWTRWGLKDEDFLPGVMADARFLGEYYSVPFDVGPLVLFYNQSHFDAAGIEGPPTTPETFVDTARKLTRSDGDQVVQWGTQFRSLWGPALWAVIRQRGGDGYFAAHDPTEVVIDSAPVREAMQFIHELLFTHQVTPYPGSPAFQPDFFTGESSSFIQGIWVLRRVQELRSNVMDLRVAGADSIFGSKQKATWANSHQLVILNQPNEDPERIDAAMTFVNFLSENSAIWARYGQLPVRMSAIQTEAFRELDDHRIIVQQQITMFPLVPWASGDGVIEQMMGRAFNPNHAEYTDINTATTIAKDALEQLVEEYQAQLPAGGL